MRPFPPGAHPRAPDLPAQPFRPGPAQDRSDPNFPDALLRVLLLALVLPAAQFAFDLDMCALGERLGELRELAEDHATVPFGVRDVLVVLLVGGLGCQRECREAAVIGSTNFWVAAEKADERTLFWYMRVSPFVEFAVVARVTLGGA